MDPKVAKWIHQLPRWQRIILSLLSLIGLEEVAYNRFGFYAWLQANKD